MSKFFHENETKFSISFDYMCKCGNENPNKFIKEAKGNVCTFLCLICERKYEITLYFKERK